MLKTLPRNGKNQEATEKNKRNKSTKRTSKIDEETKKQIKINYIRLFIMFGQKQKDKSGDFRLCVECCDENDKEIL